MPKLSKEQIKALTDKPTEYVTINLMCDGYRVSLQDSLVKRKLRTQLYVNGSFKGKWFVHPDEHPESKFYMPYIRCIKKSPRSKKKEKVDLGMRRPDFASVGQALRHLNTVCDSVEVIEEKTNEL